MPLGDWNGDGNVSIGESIYTGALAAELLESDPPPGDDYSEGGGGCGYNFGGMGCVAAGLFAGSAIFYGIVKFIRMLIFGS